MQRVGMMVFTITTIVQFAGLTSKVLVETGKR